MSIATITLEYQGAKITRKFEVEETRNPLQFANTIEDMFQAIDDLEDISL